MLYTYIRQNYTFTDEDKKKSLKTLEIILEISQKARRNGILSLETELDSYGNPFLRRALSLMIDGFEAEQINNILEKYIIFGNYADKDVLDRLLIKEGVNLILDGHSAFNICMNLAAFFGEDYIDEAENVYESFIGSTINKFYIRVKDGIKHYPDRTNLLETEIKNLSDTDIQKVLRHLDFNDLVLAINGSSAYVSERILKNVSKKIADNIAQIIAFGYDYRKYNNTELIIQAQNRILDELCRKKINKL